MQKVRIENLLTNFFLHRLGVEEGGGLRGDVTAASSRDFPGIEVGRYALSIEILASVGETTLFLIEGC